MKKFLFISLVFLYYWDIKAQSLKEYTYLGDPYNNERFLPVSIKRVSVNNNKVSVPAPGHKYKGWLFEIGYRKISFDKLKLNYDVTYKIIPEAFVPISNQINGKGSGIYRDESSTIVTGVLGWHAFNWNLIAKNKFCLAAGFNLNDFFYGTSVKDTISGKLLTKEPHGWYLTAGPSIKTHLYINKTFVLHNRFDYCYSYTKGVGVSYGIDDPSDKKPNFYVFNSTLVTKWGAFFGIEYFGILYNGKYPTNTRRFETHLGFNFVL